MKKRIAILISAKYREKDFELANKGDYELIFFDWRKPIQEVITEIEEATFDGIFSYGDKGSLIAAYFVDKNNLAGPSVASILGCQHKYIARVAQKETNPEVTPDFWGIDLSDESVEPNIPSDIQYPVIVKPAISNYSFLVQKCHSEKELRDWIDQNAQKMREDSSEYKDFIHSIAPEINSNIVVIESFGKGIQATFDGYMYEGNAYAFGITDSIMREHGIGQFDRFEYPSTMPYSLNERLRKIAEKYLQKIDFRHGSFNIEFFYDIATDQIMIIECNSRSAMQFVKMYRDATNMDMCRMMIDLSIGDDPGIAAKNYSGKEVAVCAVFSHDVDAVVLDFPSKENLKKIEEEIPKGWLKKKKKKGQKLTALRHNEDWFRHSNLYFTAPSRKEIPSLIKKGKKLAQFTFQDMKK